MRVLSAALLCLGLLFGARAEAQSARVTMNVSAHRVAVGEPFALEIRVSLSGQDADRIELPDLQTFEVLGRSTSRPVSFSFGMGQRAEFKSETVYAFTLRSMEPGAHTIRPAVAFVRGRRIASQAVNVVVLDGPSGAAAGGLRDPALDPSAASGPQPPEGPLEGAQFDRTMFLRTVVDKKRAYVGEQVTVTVYLYSRSPLSDGPALTREPTLDGFWSHDLLTPQRSLAPVQQRVNGKPFLAYVLRRFAAFPMRPGTLSIGAPTVEVGGGGSLMDLITGPSQPSRRDGVKVDVEVLPLPRSPTRGAATYTGTLSLEATLEPESAQVGDAVTLRLRAKGTGNLRALSLAAPSLQSVEVLAPEIDDRITSELDQVAGVRELRWLLLPRAPGRYVVPSFVVDVFDPVSERFETVRSAALTLNVSGASVSEAAADPAADPGDLARAKFGPVRTESALRRAERPLVERGFYWPSLLAAPLLLLLALGARRTSSILRQRRASSPESELASEVEERLRRADKALKSGAGAEALSLLGGALRKALEARLAEPIGGMTLRELERHLVSRGVDARTASRAVAQLGALEQARFDPLAQGSIELHRAVEGVRGLIAELQRATEARRRS